jgi:hypothetical protein
MKATISHMLARNAMEYVRHARVAHAKGQPPDEVRFSIGAHVMIAMALEGIANEVGAAAFDKWSWDRLEKCETPLKWRLLSTRGKSKPFEPGKEPLQSVEKLSSMRNRIAHPKVLDLGNEIIVRSKEGQVRRNVQPDEVAKDGDHVVVGLGRLLNDFTAESAHKATKRGLAAMRALTKHLEVRGLDWIEGMEKDLSRTTSRLPGKP